MKLARLWLKGKARQGFSLRSRLLLLLLLPILLVLICSGVIAYYQALYYAKNEYDQTLYDHTHSLAQLVEKHGRRIALNMPKQAKRLFLWGDFDTTYYHISAAATGFVSGLKGFPAVPAKGVRQFYDTKIYDAMIGSTPVRVATLVIDHPELGQSVIVQVAESQYRREKLTRKILLSVLVPQVILILIVGVVISLGVNKSLRPLAKMARALDEQTQYRIAPISDEGSPLEVRPLTRAINELLKRLDAALAAQRNFIANAAHQLRTPLTAIRLNMERLQTEESLVGQQEAWGHLQLSVDRAIRLSQQLLTLARVEPEAQLYQPLELVDLHALVVEVGSEWVPVALESDVELSLEGDENPIWIQAHPALLAEAMSNLIDNAIKYGAKTVVLEVIAQPQPVLKIQDDGIGIAPEDRERVFERFFRGDQGGEGSGLGLAIVRDIANLHHATLALETGLDEQGLTVSLKFPLPEIAPPDAKQVEPVAIEPDQTPITSESHKPTVDV